MGAVAQSSSHTTNTTIRGLEPEILISAIRVRGLDTSRVWLLTVPLLFMLLLAVILVCWVTRLYAKLNVSIMRLASLSELLKSCQTPYLQQRAQDDATVVDEMSRLEKVEIMYGTGEQGIVGLGCPENVRALASLHQPC
jgi:hypothetical protein